MQKMDDIKRLFKTKLKLRIINVGYNKNKK
jgi:hypothetical protein